MRGAAARARVFARTGAAPRFEVRATAEVAEVLLYDEIGVFGLSAKDFVIALAAVTAPTIRLRVNSPGGDVFDGMAMFNALRRHPARVEAHVDGLAASAASIVMLAGDTVAVAENAMVMIHDPWGIGIGNADDMRALADLLDTVTGQMVGIYIARTGQDAERIAAWMKAETWFTGKEAKDAGFADEVTANFEAAAAFDLSVFANAPRPAPEAPARPAAAAPFLPAAKRQLEITRLRAS